MNAIFVWTSNVLKIKLVNIDDIKLEIFVQITIELEIER